MQFNLEHQHPTPKKHQIRSWDYMACLNSLIFFSNYRYSIIQMDLEKPFYCNCNARFSLIDSRTIESLSSADPYKVGEHLYTFLHEHLSKMTIYFPFCIKIY